MITTFPKYWYTDRTTEITKWINKEYDVNWNEDTFIYIYIGYDGNSSRDGIESFNNHSDFINNPTRLTYTEFWKCAANKENYNLKPNTMKTLKRVTFENEKQKEDLKPMSEMQPLEVRVIKDKRNSDGYVVMRTSSKEHFEVMNISKPKEARCWDKNCDLITAPFTGNSITFHFDNE